MNICKFTICDIHISCKYECELEESVKRFLGGFLKSKLSEESQYNLYIETHNKFNFFTDHLKREICDNNFICKLYHSEAKLNLSQNTGTLKMCSLDLHYNNGMLNEDILFVLLTEVILKICMQNGFVPYHASSIAFNNTAIVLLGNAGIGKTTTVLNLIKEGYTFLGDDKVLIKNNLVYSFPKPINITCHSLTLIQSISDKYTNLYKDRRGKIRIPLSDLLFPINHSPCKINCLCILNDLEKPFYRSNINNQGKIEKIGVIYCLNSIFFENEEKDMLIDSILSLNEIPVFLKNIQYSQEWLCNFSEFVYGRLEKS